MGLHADPYSIWDKLRSILFGQVPTAKIFSNIGIVYGPLYNQLIAPMNILVIQLEMILQV